MKKCKKYLILIPLIMLSLSAPAFLFALQVEWPPSPVKQTKLSTSTVLHEFVAYLYEWGVAIGGLVVFVVLVFAGFQYLTSTGNPAKMADAMSRIKAAILGLVLLLSSWLILNIINPDLISLKEVTLQPPTELPDDIQFTTSTVVVPACDAVRLCKDLDLETCSTFDFQPGKERIRIKEGDDKRFSSYQSAEGLINGEPGGACRVVLYQKTGWFVWADKCGNPVNTIQLPSRDFRDGSVREYKVTCIDVIRVLEDKLPKPGEI